MMQSLISNIEIKSFKLNRKENGDLPASIYADYLEELGCPKIWTDHLRSM